MVDALIWVEGTCTWTAELGVKSEIGSFSEEGIKSGREAGDASSIVSR